MKITPFFEVNGKRYEIKKTRWLIAEHKRLAEESAISKEDKANAIKAQNLVSDAQKYTEKANEMWEELCENPTAENENRYFLFKRMADKAINDYNDFIAVTDSVENIAKNNIDILEIVAIKGISEQYFDLDEEKEKILSILEHEYASCRKGYSDNGYDSYRRRWNCRKCMMEEILNGEHCGRFDFKFTVEIFEVSAYD
jgi:hypothetical protein